MAEMALTDAELESVASVMTEAGSPPSGTLVSTPIAGGRSNLTFRLDDAERSWVLRTPPRTGRTPSAHDVAREYRITSALRGTAVPVAPAVAFCADERPLGGPFALWEFVHGKSLQTQRELEILDEVGIAAVVATLVSALAALHRTDHQAAGLADYGRGDSYAARQLRRWAGQWDIVGTRELSPLATALHERLERDVPEQRQVSVVHGDYRIDNTLLDVTDEGVQLSAILDWELSTIGDPVADVALMCAYRNPALDLIVGEPCAWTSERLPSVNELAAAYEMAGGASLDAWDFHLAFAYYKVAVIAAGIAHRVRSGAASGAGFDTAGRAVEKYLMLAHETMGVQS